MQSFSSAPKTSVTSNLHMMKFDKTPSLLGTASPWEPQQMARIEMVVLPASTATCPKKILADESAPVKVTFSSIEDFRDLADVFFAQNDKFANLPSNDAKFVNHIKDGMQQHTSFIKNMGYSLTQHADFLNKLKDCKVRHWRKIENNLEQMQSLQKDNLDQKQQVISISKQVGDLQTKMANISNQQKLTDECFSKSQTRATDYHVENMSKSLTEHSDNMNKLKDIVQINTEDTKLLDRKLYKQQHQILEMNEQMSNLQKQIESISNQNISEQAIEELQHGMHIHSEILDTLHNNMQTHETMINTTNKDMSVHRQSVQDVSKTIETSRKQQQ